MVNALELTDIRLAKTISRMILYYRDRTHILVDQADKCLIRNQVCLGRRLMANRASLALSCARLAKSVATKGKDHWKIRLGGELGETSWAVHLQIINR